MVSGLSARLLSSKQLTSINESTKASKDSLSGHNADLPPVLIDLDLKHKALELSRNADANGMDNKRKLSEMNYAAATVKADLSRAGRSYPLLVTTRSKVVPNLDMSGVQVVSSKSLEASPFLNSTSSILCESNFESLMNTYKKFISDTACLYKKEYENSDCDSEEYDISELDSEESETSEGASEEIEASIISSITDNESDCFNDPGKYDETIKSNGGSATKGSYISTCVVSMGEAIAVSVPARLIAVAAAPHEIVFVNAAYTSLTGLSFLETLGKPLMQLILPLCQEGVDISLQSIAMVPKDQRDDVILNLRCAGKLQSNLKCHTSITPIASDSTGRETATISSNTVTHYALDFTSESSPDDATTDKNEKSNTSEDIQLKQRHVSVVTSMSVVG